FQRARRVRRQQALLGRPVAPDPAPRPHDILRRPRARRSATSFHSKHKPEGLAERGAVLEGGAT
ncbi:MAG: hypothetical protein M3P18_15075, partial [Actinomycetota bacterium]|nr:hypothetical protein [Actinomycetota bacterium]